MEDNNRKLRARKNKTTMEKRYVSRGEEKNSVSGVEVSGLDCLMTYSSLSSEDSGGLRG